MGPAPAPDHRPSAHCLSGLRRQRRDRSSSSMSRSTSARSTGIECRKVEVDAGSGGVVRRWKRTRIGLQGELRGNWGCLVAPGGWRDVVGSPGWLLCMRAEKKGSFTALSGWVRVAMAMLEAEGDGARPEARRGMLWRREESEKIDRDLLHQSPRWRWSVPLCSSPKSFSGFGALTGLLDEATLRLYSSTQYDSSAAAICMAEKRLSLGLVNASLSLLSDPARKSSTEDLAYDTAKGGLPFGDHEISLLDVSAHRPAGDQGEEKEVMQRLRPSSSNILNLSQADSFPSSSSGPIGGFGALGASGGGHGGAGLQPARAVKRVHWADGYCSSEDELLLTDGGTGDQRSEVRPPPRRAIVRPGRPTERWTPFPPTLAAVPALPKTTRRKRARVDAPVESDSEEVRVEAEDVRGMDEVAAESQRLPDSSPCPAEPTSPPADPSSAAGSPAESGPASPRSVASSVSSGHIQEASGSEVGSEALVSRSSLGVEESEEEGEGEEGEGEDGEEMVVDTGDVPDEESEDSPSPAPAPVPRQAARSNQRPTRSAATQTRQRLQMVAQYEQGVAREHPEVDFEETDDRTHRTGTRRRISTSEKGGSDEDGESGVERKPKASLPPRKVTTYGRRRETRTPPRSLLVAVINDASEPVLTPSKRRGHTGTDKTRERTSRRKQRPEVSTDEGEQVGPVAAPEKTALERDPGVQYALERREAVADEIAAWLRSGKEQVGKSWLDLGARYDALDRALRVRVETLNRAEDHKNFVDSFADLALSKKERKAKAALAGQITLPQAGFTTSKTTRRGRARAVVAEAEAESEEEAAAESEEEDGVNSDDEFYESEGESGAEGDAAWLCANARRVRFWGDIGSLYADLSGPVQLSGGSKPMWSKLLASGRTN
ncbi:uncharacterized protein MKK02DRAFT_27893 [Dioszegia hungarica]|uniref:Uncharacterized protein n=1 Tax=Dioszegia hungarica TaxID=4972 RepID=A0AA38H976_9TREE|nr:uncharacterized protein MKK02DRAFT_27893 [Dioszegia hungarica]KAI9634734.1 hypothetical protein MKK02DRAFT_27893 [Dioszegia hungarica]